MIKCWLDSAWDEYVAWHRTDRRVVDRIHKLLRDIERDPFQGTGKPEPSLKRLRPKPSPLGKVAARSADG